MANRKQTFFWICIGLFALSFLVVFIYYSVVEKMLLPQNYLTESFVSFFGFTLISLWLAGSAIDLLLNMSFTESLKKDFHPKDYLLTKFKFSVLNKVDIKLARQYLSDPEISKLYDEFYIHDFFDRKKGAPLGYLIYMVIHNIFGRDYPITLAFIFILVMLNIAFVYNAFSSFAKTLRYARKLDEMYG